MREVKIGSQNFTKVLVVDEPGQGGACHEYRIETVKEPTAIVGQVSFQNGPVKEFGINGCHQEDLVAIVLDRLQSFQKSDYACRENALAITKLEEAMHWLNHRTAGRVSRGVEGTNIK
ncbi:hypothetical protein H8E88_27875 [candidate division KSB1 bacterium]|nr:hypothetical protein [candidate division KSB1 bacterium]